LDLVVSDNWLVSHRDRHVSAATIASGFSGYLNIFLPTPEWLAITVLICALGLEPGERDRMSRPPRDPNERLPNRRGVYMILGAGSYIAAAAALFYFYLGDASTETIARA
jgi:magnesium-transporting ATPase (P-type)